MMTIIGCGNTNRSDDGVGVYVARRLQEQLGHYPTSCLRIFDAGTAGMDVMFQARGSSALIIVDANLSGSKPGDIFEVPGEELANIKDPGYNLHDFRWDHALYAGKKIFKEEFPDDVTVYLIEAGNIDMGLSLTDKVSEAGDRVVEKIIRRVESLDCG